MIFSMLKWRIFLKLWWKLMEFVTYFKLKTLFHFLGICYEEVKVLKQNVISGAFSGIYIPFIDLYIDFGLCFMLTNEEITSSSNL